MFTAAPPKSPIRHKKPQRSLAERHRSFQRNFGQKAEEDIKGRLRTSVRWAWSEFRHWLCYYKEDEEVDFEELLSNPFNTQPPSLDELSKATGFRKQWIMFLYRNFKQKCLNGRMSLTQWRQIFRLIFKNATDIEFADRIFMTIAGNRSQHLITFEDLIMCLYDLSRCSQTEATTSKSPSTTAQFAFSLMKPNDQGRVDIRSFLEYVECVHSLNSRPMGCSEGVFDHLISSSHSNSVSIRSSQRSPALQTFATEQFKILDEERKGYLTVCDLERLFSKSPWSKIMLNSDKPIASINSDFL